MGTAAVHHMSPVTPVSPGVRNLRLKSARSGCTEWLVHFRVSPLEPWRQSADCYTSAHRLGTVLTDSSAQRLAAERLRLVYIHLLSSARSVARSDTPLGTPLGYTRPITDSRFSHPAVTMHPPSITFKFKQLRHLYFFVLGISS